ncbi:MAG: hypothetical protein AN188_01576 [Candidatus Methanofastidiosum methylothiophilum]|uniref:Uncharacterized protein n=1 Tax=Candidatus Methanofastidiosum methylothiophilum TaxID=1705564 RepID=A0A150J5X4_9EURY|nr:MAG: hypothetical protein AN188_01576 [Candidatus Methanofastidiosum methylthiophilus]
MLKKLSTENDALEGEEAPISPASINLLPFRNKGKTSSE